MADPRPLQEPAMTDEDYTIVVELLQPADGDGSLATVPDPPGRPSDGETREEAARNGTDAIAAWIEEATRLGRLIRFPGNIVGFATLQANAGRTNSRGKTAKISREPYYTKSRRD